MINDEHVSIRLPASIVNQLRERAARYDEWDLSKEIRHGLKLYLATVDERALLDRAPPKDRKP